MRSCALFMTLTVVLVVVCTLASPARNARAEYAVDRVTNRVLAYFTSVNGVVEAIEDGSVRVRLESGAAIRKGMRFSVFRESEPFYHPVTNELIGSSEAFVGRLEVKGDEDIDGLYPCAIITGDIEESDKVRISSSKVKLAFFQERKSNWAISEAFYNSLKKSGRFEILESYTANYETSTLSKLGRDLGAEAVLLFSTPAEQKDRFLNVKLYWSQDASMFGEIKEKAVQQTDILTEPDQELVSPIITDMQPWGSYSLTGGELIAMGDVDGNGIREFVVSDGNDISIYSLKEDLRELWFIQGPPEERHLSIDVLDVNKNGKAEIFVTSLTGGSILGASVSGDEIIPSGEDGRLSSYVLEYDPSEGYRKIQKNMPYFLRVTEKTLLMQKFKKYKSFSGPVYEGAWSKGRYQRQQPLTLPDGVNIYGFTYIDWNNDGTMHLATFDDNGYLHLFDERGKALWKSGKSYGKFVYSFEKRSYSVATPSATWVVRGRLLTVNAEGGQELVVVRKKSLLPRVPGLGLGEAEVFTLVWDGTKINEKLIMNKLSGAVTDYCIEGRELFLIAKGTLFTVLKKATAGELSRVSMLYYYIFGEE